jgi:hypothetical protein
MQVINLFLSQSVIVCACTHHTHTAQLIESHTKRSLRRPNVTLGVDDVDQFESM